MKEKTIALVSPFHDPRGSLLTEATAVAPILKNIFDVVYVSLSDQTSRRYLDIFERNGMHFEFRVEDGDIGERYRACLRAGIAESVEQLLLMDFDRALHWARSFPDELEVVAEQIKVNEGFTSLVRSRRAFETHPQTQRETELVANEIASEVVGRQVDILSGAYGMDVEVAKVLVKEISKNDFGFYGEILAIPFREGFEINGIEVEGLEWETPDQYKEEIHKVGYSQWLNNFQSLEEWEKRLTLAFEAGKSVEEIK